MFRHISAGTHYWVTLPCRYLQTVFLFYLFLRFNWDLTCFWFVNPWVYWLCVMCLKCIIKWYNSTQVFRSFRCLVLVWVVALYMHFIDVYHMLNFFPYSIPNSLLDVLIEPSSLLMLCIRYKKMFVVSWFFVFVWVDAFFVRININFIVIIFIVFLVFQNMKQNDVV